MPHSQHYKYLSQPAREFVGVGLAHIDFESLVNMTEGKDAATDMNNQILIGIGLFQYYKHRFVLP